MQRQLAFALACVLAAALPVVAAPVRVTGRIAAPVPAGARIDLLPAFVGYDDALRLLAGGPEPPPLASARPLADGSFELFAPEEGLFRIRVQAPGCVAVERDPVPLVEETELPPARLKPAVETEVTVLGPEGQPLAGIRFSASGPQGFNFREENTGWRPVDGGGTTGEKGKLHLSTLAAERIDLPALDLSLLGQEAAEVLQRFARAGERIDLTALTPAFLGQEAEAQVGGKETIRLAAGPLRTVEVRGRDGRPVAGAVLWQQRRPITATGAAGRLSLLVPQQRAGLMLEGPTGEWAELTFGPDEDGSKPKVVTLSNSPAVVAGRVLDAATRAPLPGALLWGRRTWVRAGADGGFRLPLAPGSQQASFRAVAAAHVQSSQQPQKGSSPDITVLLDPAGSILGRVVDSEGRPVGDARLEATAPGSERGLLASRDAVWSNPDGSFQIRGLPAAAPYEVRVTREAFAEALLPAWSSSPGQATPPLRIVLSRGSTAVGKVLDEQGAAIPGARLTLRRAAEGGEQNPRRSHDPGRQLFRTISDAAGAFRFQNLFAGRFDLWVEHPKLVSVRLPGVEITGTAGEVDLGTVTLQEGVEVEGRVIDARGAPVEGASVDPYPSTGATVVTGPDGRFRLTGLARGRRFHLSVSREGYAESNLPGLEAPTLEPVQVVLQDLALRRLTGRVLDPEGRPVAGAQVITFTEHERGLGGGKTGYGHWSYHPTTTDGEGKFVLTGDAGEVSFGVRAPGYRMRLVRGLRFPEQGDAAPVEVTLERGAILEGRVVDGRGEPVAGADVRAHLEDRDDRMLSSPHGATDTEGRYRLEGLELGEHNVMVRVEGNDQLLQRPTEVRPGVNRLDFAFDSGVEVSGRVTDAQGTPLPAVALLLRPVRSRQTFSTRSRMDGTFLFPAVTNGIFQLEGSASGFARTLDPREVHIAGRPVEGLELRLARGARIVGSLLGLPADELAGAEIVAMLEGPPGGRLFGTVGPGSRYQIPDAAPGTWRVFAYLYPHRQAEGSVEVAPAGEEVVLDLQFAAGLKLSGQVLLDGKPLPGTDILVASQRQGSETRRASTRYDGSFEIDGLQPGAWQLLIAPDAGPGYARSLELTSDQEVSIEISTGSAAGHVLTPAGSPVPEALVSLRGSGPEPDIFFSGPRVQTDDQGAFEFPRLAAGSYLLKVEKDGFAPKETPITVTPGGTVQVQVVLEPEPQG